MVDVDLRERGRINYCSYLMTWKRKPLEIRYKNDYEQLSQSQPTTKTHRQGPNHNLYISVYLTTVNTTQPETSYFLQEVSWAKHNTEQNLMCVSVCARARTWLLRAP